MSVQPLASTDGFVVRDFEDVPATAFVRSAPKLLVDGARWLARSLTYRHAVFGQQISGASAGVNARTDERPDALASFCAEVLDAVREGRLALEPGKGVTDEDLAPLRAVDPRGERWWSARDQLTAAGVLGSCRAAGVELAGAEVVLEGCDVLSVGLRRELLGQLHEAGAALVGLTVAASGVSAPGGLDPEAVAALDLDASASDPAAALTGFGEPATAEAVLASPCSVVLVGSRAGVIGHELASSLGAGLVVPWGPLPVTAKALAVLTRRGVAVLPDFVTTAGPSLVGSEGAPSPDDAGAAAHVQQRIAEVLEVAGSHPRGALLGACEQAEAFLRTWRPELPFGRPLA